MPTVEQILKSIKHNQKNERFSDLKKVCDKYFGEARNTGGSHYVYRMPWKGDPRINIQNDNGKAKEYQVKQVLTAIEKLKGGGVIE